MRALFETNFNANWWSDEGSKPDIDLTMRAIELRQGKKEDTFISGIGTARLPE